MEFYFVGSPGEVCGDEAQRIGTRHEPRLRLDFLLSQFISHHSLFVWIPYHVRYFIVPETRGKGGRMEGWKKGGGNW